MGGVAPACKWLIVTNVVVFVLQLFTLELPGGGVTGWLMLSPDRVTGNWEVWRILTYAFCHNPDDPLHLAFNMLGLWIFGNQVESLYGQREFLRFYLTAALISGVGFLAFQMSVNRPGVAVGASGAVMAVMMLCAMYYPSMKILIMFVIPIELRWLIVIYVVYDMLPLLRELGGAHPLDQIAHSAHLGGLLYGFLYKRFDLRYSRLLAGWNWPGLKRLVLPARQPKNVRLYEPPEERVPTPDLSRRVDEILAKISAQGESSLTPSEREILKEASRRFKKK